MDGRKKTKRDCPNLCKWQKNNIIKKLSNKYEFECKPNEFLC